MSTFVKKLSNALLRMPPLQAIHLLGIRGKSAVKISNELAKGAKPCSSLEIASIYPPALVERESSAFFYEIMIPKWIGKVKTISEMTEVTKAEISIQNLLNELNTMLIIFAKEVTVLKDNPSYAFTKRTRLNRKQREKVARLIRKDILSILDRIKGLPIPIKRQIDEFKVNLFRFQKEAFLYGCKGRALTTISYQDLNCFRLEENEWRAQFGISLGTSFADGISIVFAEKQPRTAQPFHAHYNHETTSFLSEGSQVDQLILTTGGELGHNIYSPHLGDRVFIPPKSYHRLENPGGNLAPDFTIKDPLTSLLKEDLPPATNEREIIRRLSALPESERKNVELLDQVKTRNISEGVTEITVGDYPDMHYQVRLNDQGLIAFNPNIKEVIPETNGKITIKAKLLLIEPGKSTKLSFSPLYDNTQVVYCLPWPQNIPHNWSIEKEIGGNKLKATVAMGRRTITISGGDLFVIDGDSISSNKLTLTNIGELTAMFLIVVPAESKNPHI